MNIAVNTVEFGRGFVPNPVKIKGEGSPVVFMHSFLGQEWNGMLDDLAKTHKVIAPAHPGSVMIESMPSFSDLKQLGSFWDLVLYYDDLFDSLGLENFDLIGHSFGGMVAAEYAATFSKRVNKLVLIDAMGLWDDANPVADHYLTSDDSRKKLMYHDLKHPEVVKRLTDPTDPEGARDAYIGRFLGLGSSAHFIHPIPERGLNKRLHRIRAKTLVVWGKNDTLTPPFYADAFKSKIAGAKVEMIADAGHTPYVEQREKVSAVVGGFLG